MLKLFKYLKDLLIYHTVIFTVGGEKIKFRIKDTSKWNFTLESTNKLIIEKII